MTELAHLRFYATQANSCSHLPDEQAKTLHVDSNQPVDVHVYADLSEMGFRRSGGHLYRHTAKTVTHASRRASLLGHFYRTATKSASSSTMLI